MAINQNWETYKVNIGWKEVSASEVFSKSIILQLLNETIDKNYLNNIMNPSYTKGQLKFNE